MQLHESLGRKIVDWDKTRVCPREPAIQKIKIETGFNNAYNANNYDNANNAYNHLFPYLWPEALVYFPRSSLRRDVSFSAANPVMPRTRSTHSKNLRRIALQNEIITPLSI
jgi:hypothetical protein